MTERAAPFYCPYCGEEDLRPSEAGPGAWECADCNRAFRLNFLGLLSSGFAAVAAAAGGAGAGLTTSGPHIVGHQHTGFSGSDGAADQHSTADQPAAGRREDA